jgi:hypothetical protein
MANLSPNSTLPVSPNKAYYKNLTTNKANPNPEKEQAYNTFSMPAQTNTQVAILKTVTNTNKPTGEKHKPFKKLPSLALVSLEVAGLGLLAFVGNYMGKLAYCENNKLSIAGDVKTFDSLATHYQALKKVIGYYENENFFPTQVEGGWLSHANQLTALIKEYCTSPTKFTGIRLENLKPKPDAIRKELYGYAMTALEYYKKTGNVIKQVEIANLLYDHKLSIPKAAHTDVSVALETFNNTDCDRISLWDSKKMAPLFKRFGIDTSVTHEEWKTKFIRQVTERPEFKNQTNPNNQALATKLLQQINTYTAMMESLNVISSIRTASTEEIIPKLMKTFWLKNYLDLKPLNSSGNDVELTLLFKAFEIITRQYHDLQRTFQIERFLHELPNKSISLKKLTNFMHQDLTAEQNTVDTIESVPLLVTKWLHNQTNQLVPQNRAIQPLLTEMLDCVDPKNPELTQKNLIAFYDILKTRTGTTLFILKLWAHLALKDESGIKVIIDKMGSLDSIHPTNTFRFEPVGMFFNRYDSAIQKIIQKTTSPSQ